MLWASAVKGEALNTQKEKLCVICCCWNLIIEKNNASCFAYWAIAFPSLNIYANDQGEPELRLLINYACMLGHKRNLTPVVSDCPCA